MEHWLTLVSAVGDILSFAAGVIALGIAISSWRHGSHEGPNSQSGHDRTA